MRQAKDDCSFLQIGWDRHCSRDDIKQNVPLRGQQKQGYRSDAQAPPALTMAYAAIWAMGCATCASRGTTTNASRQGAAGVNKRPADRRVQCCGQEGTRYRKRTSASWSSLRKSSQSCLSAWVQDTRGQPVSGLTGRGAVHGKSMSADPFGGDPHQESIKENCQ